LVIVESRVAFQSPFVNRLDGKNGTVDSMLTIMITYILYFCCVEIFTLKCLVDKEVCYSI